jgi:hypothetical protein
VAYVPPPEQSGRLAAQGRFSHEDFDYDADQDAYRCPADKLLKPMKGFKINGSRRERRYVSLKSVCKACPLRAQCLSAKGATRTIYRWEHEDVLDRHRTRMKGAGTMMRLRASVVEHPFGTLKCRAGYRHFLLRGFDKVRGEWSLMALCYNFSRVLNIVGLDNFREYIAQRASQLAIFCLRRLATICRLGVALTAVWVASTQKSAKNGIWLRWAI